MTKQICFKQNNSHVEHKCGNQTMYIRQDRLYVLIQCTNRYVKLSKKYYTGKTDSHYHISSCEHLGITPLQKKASTRKGIKSEVRDHLLETNHTPCMSGFSIIGGVMSTDFHLRLKESLYIHKDKP